MPFFEIKSLQGTKKIGQDAPVFIVAEMSCNHNQKIDRAYKIIDMAAKAGVDAIKMQTYTPDTITINSNLPSFQIKEGPWAGKNLYQLYESAYTPWEWQAELISYAEKRGLIAFSTPFDTTAVDFLESLNVALYKVASFETSDLELLKRIGQTKKPVILSRGMTSKENLTLAINTLREAGSSHVAILHCISAYPAPINEMNLATIPDLSKMYNLVTGLSDHTRGNTTAITAVGLGAQIIEKHITLRRSDGGPDALFSLEPTELADLVSALHEAKMAIGKPTYEMAKDEKPNIIFRRSLFIVQDIKAGEILTNKNVRCIRPGNGLEPKHFQSILGKVAKSHIPKGTPLSWDLLEK